MGMPAFAKGYGAYHLSMTTMHPDCIDPDTGGGPAVAVLLRQAPDEEEDEEEDEDDGKENDDDDDTTDDGYSKARRVQWQIGVRGGRQRPLGS